jgi:hypothetical protein
MWLGAHGKQSQSELQATPGCSHCTIQSGCAMLVNAHSAGLRAHMCLFRCCGLQHDIGKDGGRVPVHSTARKAKRCRPDQPMPCCLLCRAMPACSHSHTSRTRRLVGDAVVATELRAPYLAMRSCAAIGLSELDCLTLLTQ